MHTLQMLGGILWHVCGACETLSAYFVTHCWVCDSPERVPEESGGNADVPQEDRAMRARGQTEAREGHAPGMVPPMPITSTSPVASVLSSLPDGVGGAPH